MRHPGDTRDRLNSYATNSVKQGGFRPENAPRRQSLQKSLPRNRTQPRTGAASVLMPSACNRNRIFTRRRQNPQVPDADQSKKPASREAFLDTHRDLRNQGQTQFRRKRCLPVARPRTHDRQRTPLCSDHNVQQPRNDRPTVSITEDSGPLQITGTNDRKNPPQREGQQLMRTDPNHVIRADI